MLSYIFDKIFRKAIDFFLNLVGQKMTERKAAQLKFRDAFVPEISLCKSSKKFRIQEATYKVLEKHEEAVVTYIQYVPDAKKVEFEKLWEQYKEMLRYPNINHIADEIGIEKQGYIKELNEEQQRKKTLSLLQRLVAYAK